MGKAFEKWWEGCESQWYEPSATFDVGLVAEDAWKAALEWVLNTPDDDVWWYRIEKELNK